MFISISILNLLFLFVSHKKTTHDIPLCCFFMSFNRDPYFMVYYIPHITGARIIPYRAPNQPGAWYSIAHVSFTPQILRVGFFLVSEDYPLGIFRELMWKVNLICHRFTSLHFEAYEYVYRIKKLGDRHKLALYTGAIFST